MHLVGKHAHKRIFRRGDQSTQKTRLVIVDNAEYDRECVLFDGLDGGGERHGKYTQDEWLESCKVGEYCGGVSGLMVSDCEVIVDD